MYFLFLLALMTGELTEVFDAIARRVSLPALILGSERPQNPKS